jgi:diguanylate cyclase
MEIFDLASRLIGMIGLIAIIFGTVERQQQPWFVRNIEHGLAFGLSAVVCMTFPVVLSNGAVINGRSLFLAFAAAFGGVLPFVVAAIVTTVCHLIRNDVGLTQIVHPMIAAGGLGLAWRWTVARKFGYGLWSLITLGGLVSLVSLLLIILSPSGGGRIFLLLYPAVVGVSMLAALILGLLVDRELRHFKDEKLWRQEAYTDALTKLANKRAFQEDYGELTVGDAIFSLILLDVDHFKRVNDTYGHPIGDEVLRHIAGVLDKGMASDGKAYRLGGEEFAIILRSRDLLETANFADALRQTVFRTLGESAHRLPVVTVSAGIAISTDKEHCREILAAADAALYHAKSSGRDRVSSWLDVLTERLGSEPRALDTNYLRPIAFAPDAHYLHNCF